MPASLRPRRLHHWGTNALIYIAQECTARGSRCLHLYVQEHNSRCARLRRCSRRRELKKMPASPRHTRVQKMPASATSYARLPLACVQKMPALATSSPVGLPLHRPKMAASTSTRAKMHASPATLAPKMAASKAVTEFETWSCRLHLSSHVLLTIRSDVRMGLGYK